MEEPQKELIFSRKVIEMITVANEFCIFIEESAAYEKIQILAYLERVVPLLYLKGSLLPDVVVSDDSANVKFVNEEQWQECFNRLKEKFGKDDAFYTNENAGEKECVKYSIAENVADLYQDMKDFILLYQVNTMASRENAIFFCKLNFESQWGYRAIRSMFAIHHVLHGHPAKVDYPGFHNN
jgi:hypothetical protein